MKRYRIEARDLRDPGSRHCFSHDEAEREMGRDTQVERHVRRLEDQIAFMETQRSRAQRRHTRAILRAQEARRELVDYDGFLSDLRAARTIAPRRPAARAAPRGGRVVTTEPYDQQRDVGLDFVEWSVEEIRRMQDMSVLQVLAVHREAERFLFARGENPNIDSGSQMLGVSFLCVVFFVAGYVFGPLIDALIRLAARSVS
jgi:hypothetical protein